jgi:hypothetical protein
LPDGSILSRNSVGAAYLRVGSSTGLGSGWVYLASQPAVLKNAIRLGTGGFQFSFTNIAGTPFTVLTSTNVAWPLSQWSSLGAPVESSAGQFQFTDPQAPNGPARFYRVRSP